MSSAFLKKAEWKQQKAQTLIPRGSWVSPWLPLWKPLASSESAANSSHGQALPGASLQVGQVSPTQVILLPAGNTNIWGNPNLGPAENPSPSFLPFQIPWVLCCTLLQHCEHRDENIPTELQLQQCREDTHYKTSPVLNRRGGIWLRTP